MSSSVPKLLLLVVVCHCVQGCYYWQAARGQWDLARSRVPVSEVLANPVADSHTRRKLALAQRALDFAHDELGLPDNGSYREYVALGRDYVVVNVFAAPEFSLQPKTWCYPVAGCIAYRGYFDAADADKKASRLRAAGLDVATSRVPAYSTLGRFRDPLLSTMLGRNDDRLVSLLFHELAHQQIYVPGDTAFNESFATAVAEIGLARWRAAGFSDVAPADAAERDRRLEVRARVFKLLETLRADLGRLYSAELPVETMRQKKRQRFEQLARDWRGSGATAKAPHNNAALVPLAVYNDLTPAFIELYTRANRDLPEFYREVRTLADRDQRQRDAQMAELLAAARAR